MTLVMRSPETCPHRAAAGAGGRAAGCRLAARVASGGRPDAAAVPVGPGACEACCRLDEPTPERLNAVVASLVVGAVGADPRAGRARSRFAGALDALGRAARRGAVARLSLAPSFPTPPPAPGPTPPPAPGPLPVPHPFPAPTPPPPGSLGSGLLRGPGGRPLVGLVGPGDASGVGSIDRDLVAHGLVRRWLIPGGSSRDGRASPAGARCRVEVAAGAPGPESLRARARGLDWVVFVEQPAFPGLVWRAREMGAAVACVPMWEWTHPEADWLAGVDLMIAPTVHAFEQLLAWKRRLGFAWELTHVPWPVDLGRFPFRERRVCERFLHVNGRGGCLGRRGDGTPTPYRRKGLDLVLEAARLLPGARFLIRSQVPLEGDVPPNVEVRGGAETNDRLYDEGDVCVQPSRWEGIGLSLLECQAAGLPLVTTDAPPMNEFAPFRAVRAERVETVFLERDRPVSAHLVAPDRLAAVLSPLVGADIAAASRAARGFVTRSHGWPQAARLLAGALARRPVVR